MFKCSVYICFTCYFFVNHLVLAQDGYSYFKFSGPVSGDIHTVPVESNHHGQTYDYVAKPDYFYSYGVDDPHTGNSQSHKESRDGHSLYGEYSVIQPDGIVRTVRYTADPKNGFQATVEYSKH